MAVEVTLKNSLVERRFDPEGGRIFAVGDIHGCYDKLVEMVGLIEGYERASNDIVIFLGDYVDKGPDSLKVVDFIKNYQKESPNTVFPLMGNHDYHFITMMPKWAKNSWAKPTIDSYENSNIIRYFQGKKYKPLLTDKIKEHRAYLKSLPVGLLTDKFLFVHAGIEVTKTVWEQDPRTLLFIRESFTKKKEIDCGYKIVHGHHKIESGKVYIGKERINVDTACYKTGVLSCVVLDDRKGEVIEVLQTKPTEVSSTERQD